MLFLLQPHLSVINGKFESGNSYVDDSGVVTGVKAGTATIKVTADDFSASPVSTTFTVKINPVIQIENFEFTNEAKEYLGQLGYGEVYGFEKVSSLDTFECHSGID